MAKLSKREKAIREKFSGKVGEMNVAAAKAAYFAATSEPAQGS